MGEASGSEQRVDAIVTALTLEEKLGLVAGANAWHTVAVPRVGLPALRLSDGPNGVRGIHVDRGPTAACFPVATALASTWDVGLLAEIGDALATEADDKGVHVVLAPTLNLHRFPLAGRNFECFSEDPVLTARLAVALVGALQDRGVAATVKHFAGNESEVERYSASSQIGERALRELYLAPFEAAVRDGGVWAVMSAYNRLNGVSCSANRWLLTDLLKQHWGFDGLVMSDWGGTYATVEPALAGLDLEMPGPAVHFGERLRQAVHDGVVPEAVLDDKVRRLVRLAARTGALDAPEPRPEVAVDRPEVWALARRAAAESMVLLRNDGLLPVDLTDVRRVAVIGPNATPGQIMGGGSSQVRPHRVSEPLAALVERLGPQVEVRYEPGVRTHRLVPLPPEHWQLRWEAAWFADVDLQGDPVQVSVLDRVALSMSGPRMAGLDPERFGVRFRTTVVPPTDGSYRLGVTAIGRSRVLVDGAVVVDNWTAPRPGHTFYAWGSTEVTGRVELRAGQPVELVVDCARVGGPFPGIRFGLEPPDDVDRFTAALGAARAADLVVLVVGSNVEWESEGFDRDSFELPGRQNELIDAVLGVNRNTVVVVNAGAPVSMHWAPHAPALLYAWYPGMAFGEALADVLLGDVAPAGRLPTTFPVRLEDHPAYLNYPGEHGQVDYGEGVFVGYRGFDARDTEPLFPFGFGLSTTTFDYGPLRIEASDPTVPSLTVAIDVTNTGTRRGAEVVQCYLADTESTVARPPKELVAFDKVRLDPGEVATVRFTLDRRAFAFWSAPAQDWVVEPGRFDVLVGSSSRDIRATRSWEVAAPGTED